MSRRPAGTAGTSANGPGYPAHQLCEGDTERRTLPPQGYFRVHSTNSGTVKKCHCKLLSTAKLTPNTSTLVSAWKPKEHDLWISTVTAAKAFFGVELITYKSNPVNNSKERGGILLPCHKSV